MSFELDPDYKKKRISNLQGGSRFPADSIITGEEAEVLHYGNLVNLKKQLKEDEAATDVAGLRKMYKRTGKLVEKEISDAEAAFEKRGIRIRRVE